MAECVLLMVRSVKVQRVFLSHGALTVLILTVLAVSDATSTNNLCDGVKCVHGTCKNVTESLWICMCDQGWGGSSCDSCLGRVKLVAEEGKVGVITDGAGNYSLDVKCSWIITGTPGVPIRLRVWEFATECSWDHLYVYDGDSVYSPLIAAFSGLMVFRRGESLPEITAQSGSAYLHFYSDAAYNMSGFNITFKQGACPLDCSGHGQCLRSGRCKCEERWKGDGCNKPICPANCSRHGYCDHTDRQCYCEDGHTGIDCSINATRGHWKPLGKIAGDGQASHAAVVVGQYMWIVGGYTFNEVLLNLTRFNLATDTHSVIELSTDTRPQPRHGHSLVAYRDHLYMYGGLLGGAIITDELWEFDLVSNEWTEIDLEIVKRAHPESTYFAVNGHTAHVIGSIMHVIFGHSTIYGYLNTVQECNMDSFVWTVPATDGAIVKGGYGHSSVYDPRTLLIYVHGGYHSASVTSYHLSDSLYAYNPNTRTWKILRSSGEFKYLHSAVIQNGLMLVFGGNTHNDTMTSHGATCYSINFFAYDINCDRWYTLDEPKLAYDVARYGHTAVDYDNHMFVFGGFNGELLRDLLVYKPGNCKYFKSRLSCLTSRQGIRCAWANDAHCLPLREAMESQPKKIIDTYEAPICETSPGDPKRGCEELPTKTCPSCVANSLRCVWCDGQCSHGYCSNAKKTMTVLGCHNNFTKTSSVCPTLHNCHACRSNDACLWSPSDKKCHLRMKSQSDSEKLSKCPAPCNTHTTCENCTSATCMWCSNERRCVESNSYVVSFLYGQCMEWTTMQSKCPATRCSEMRTCHECKMAPSCGWCNEASNTGVGVCMTGGATGPTQQGTGAVSLSNKCPSERWFFTHCPLCQCNGHSMCRPGTDQCDACSPLVTGPQCQYCKDGYWGTATNGGNCTACDCGDQADTCNRLTGTCYCHTRGVFGKHCDMCEEKYYGNPEDGGTCYYELVTDYQFTFNLSKEEDTHYTHINFMNTPVKNDHDVDFTVNCSGHAYINVTVVSSRLSSETYIQTGFKCHYLSTKFSHKLYAFGEDTNTTFFVYVYDFDTPFLLQISFSQFPQVDLIHFFITFFSCFLSLLVLALTFWKLKQKYDSYQREQRRKLMLKQRAKRPVETCVVDATSPYCSLIETEPPDLLAPHRHRPNKPSPVALEPIMNRKAAALSLLIRMPTGDDDYTPPGVSGLCIGTALVTLGSRRKLSVEHAKPTRTKKPSVTSENCV